MKWMARGDIDGFFGLAIDNLVQLLVIDALCRGVLGFSVELVYGRILPGAAVSLLVGNLYYARQALRAGAPDRADRRLRPALRHQHRLPLRLRLPRHAAGQARGRGRRRGRSRRPSPGRRGSSPVSGRGSSSSPAPSSPSGSGKSTPRAALLSTLAGIALTFISLGFLFRTYARPIVGLTTLAIVLLVYFGRVRFRGGLPGGLVAVCRRRRRSPGSPASRPSAPRRRPRVAFHPPLPVFGELFAALPR